MSNEVSTIDPKALDGLVNAVLEFSRTLEGGLERQVVRTAIHGLGTAMEALPQHECPLDHIYADGLYGRRWFCEAPALIVTEIHKVQHISMLLKGRIAVASPDGCSYMEAPQFFVTEAGTQRVILVLEDAQFATVHLNPTNEQDPDALKSLLTVRDYKDLNEVTV